ncbi:CDP-glycerol glycerophosphotransferase family protein [Streptococcus sp. NLN76]|uniref:CDP-glycerol glycerophosphotransferase family protein n=1 Tax=Streptococcus sp. NLN76 TaxID=2822800 RepID=UPI0018A9E034|nr:CDP-glycerol glycerophosphotransferase family protein [Streptococcus sp. NLN76]MBF8969894.1 CDP-glycerol glycerophosphotransferase family protein [Streptococcus sp. NLN76]
MFKETIKYNYIAFLRAILKPFTVIPVKQNRVIFESFAGEGYNCNPKYISLELLEQSNGSAEVIWAFTNPENFKSALPEDVKVCKYRSLKHIYYRLTSRVYVSNFLQAIEVPKNKKQIVIQTWHGGGSYKTVGSAEKGRQSPYIKRQNIQLKETDYFVSSSNYFRDEVVREQFGFRGETINKGMPRNDILINPRSDDRNSKIREKLGIAEDKIVVLYAPTWKQTTGYYEELNVIRLKDSVKERFGRECEVLFRTHIYGNQKLNNVKSVSDYPDMQELLLISDILISDYSSSIWDFSFTGKPCFLFTPDLKDYTENRGFDKDIFSWGFPVCSNNVQLDEAIKSYSEENFLKAMEKHHTDLESTESGVASKEITSLIFSKFQ